MNYKKLFTGIMVVALITTMYVGFTSCSENRDVIVPVDKSGLIQHNWFNPLQGHRIEFRANLTYSYEHSNFGSGTGNYKILETIEDQELWFSDDDIFNTTLFKILASGGNMVFDEIWVYHTVWGNTPNIAVEFYANKELLPDDLKFYHVPNN